MKLSVSILSIKNNIKENILKLSKLDIDYLHIDIMDNLFVPNKTWNIDEVKEIVPNNYKKFDVHLMVYDLDKYIKDFISLKPNIITFHLEATNNVEKYIQIIHENNILAGISIKPNTSIESIKPYLKDIDLVLVMSVEPGFGGQKFIENSENKINELLQIKKENNYNYLIEVDGGVNKDTMKFCKNCDIVVVGSYITNNDYEESIKNIKSEI